MRCQYTDEQIRAALIKATEELKAFEISGEVDGAVHHDPDYWPSDEIRAVRSILRHLPEAESDTNK